MNAWRLTMLSLVLVAAASPALAQDVSAEKRAEITKLLDETGAMKIAEQMSPLIAAQINAALRNANTNLPQRAYELVPEEVNAVLLDNMGSFKEQLIRLYDRYYTLEDLKGLNQFYASELGRKVTRTLPRLVQESMAVGQKWGESLGPEFGRRIQERFRKEGL